MEEVGQAAQLRAGELIIIVVVLVMWAGRSSSSPWHIHLGGNPHGPSESGGKISSPTEDPPHRENSLVVLSGLNCKWEVKSGNGSKDFSKSWSNVSKKEKKNVWTEILGCGTKTCPATLT